MLLQYLSSDCFNPGLNEESVKTNILSGAYVLQNYAIGQWLEHVKRCGEETSELPYFQIICELIDEFIHKRTNTKVEMRAKMITVPHQEDFRAFEKDWAVIHQKLLQIEAFSRRRKREFCLKNGKMRESRNAPSNCYYLVSLADIKTQVNRGLIQIPSRYQQLKHLFWGFLIQCFALPKVTRKTAAVETYDMSTDRGSSNVTDLAVASSEKDSSLEMRGTGISILTPGRSNVMYPNATSPTWDLYRNRASTHT
jgi:hypothetical protein